MGDSTHVPFQHTEHFSFYDEKSPRPISKSSTQIHAIPYHHPSSILLGSTWGECVCEAKGRNGRGVNN